MWLGKLLKIMDGFKYQNKELEFNSIVTTIIVAIY